MKILCVFGRHNYGDAARGEGVEYSQFLPALRELGHEVYFFESFARTGHADFAALNRALLKEVEENQPDVVFTVLILAEIWLETIGLIRRAGCKVGSGARHPQGLAGQPPHRRSADHLGDPGHVDNWNALRVSSRAAGQYARS